MHTHTFQNAKSVFQGQNSGSFQVLLSFSFTTGNTAAAPARHFIQVKWDRRLLIMLNSNVIFLTVQKTEWKLCYVNNEFSFIGSIL